MALLGWSAGCAMIWSSLFATGAFLYGRTTQAIALTAVFLVSVAIVSRSLRQMGAGETIATEKP
jgi:hypothetical protein